MAQELRAQTAAGPIAQGLVDMAQSWSRLAAEIAPQVPELPGVIQQEVATLGGKELTEELVNTSARSISRRVEAAGYPDEAALLLRRMGRAMYELLLVVATQEELRAMGLLLAAAPPLAAGNGASRPPAEEASSGPTTGRKDAPTPSANQAIAIPPRATSKAPAPAPPAAPAAHPAGPRPVPKPTQGAPANRAAPRATPTAGAGSAQGSPPMNRVGSPEAVSPAAPEALPSRPLETEPARPESAEMPAVGPTLPAPMTAAATTGPDLEVNPAAASAAERPAAQAATGAETASPSGSRPATPAAAGPPPAPRPPRADAAVEEVSLWGFDPTAREQEQDEPPAKPQALEPTVAPEVAIVVEATPAPARPTMQPVEGPSAPVSAASGWRVRLSPRQSQERERKVGSRRPELKPLMQEIVTQVHEQRRAVSERGPARQAVHMSAELGAPADMASAQAQLDTALAGGNLERAAAVVLRTTEAYPGEISAELACRAGVALREAKRDDLATLALTTAVLAAPPQEQACWQLAGLALEGRDPRLAPIWLEFVARLLRVRGADEDAVVVYRQLLNLCPRRADVREILRVASLTGSLPETPLQAIAG